MVLANGIGDTFKVFASFLDWLILHSKSIDGLFVLFTWLIGSCHIEDCELSNRAISCDSCTTHLMVSAPVKRQEIPKMNLGKTPWGGIDYFR